MNKDDGIRSTYIDLSHVIEDGMVTYKGLPTPKICDFWTREYSRQFFTSGTEFQIGKIEMVANTGTYIDSPFHRLANGKDFTQLDLECLVNIPGILVHAPFETNQRIDKHHFSNKDIEGKAVLVYTGWDKYWRTEAYFDGNPYITGEAAELLRDSGAVLVGIDSLNIDNTSDGDRPVHTILLGANIPIVEHMCGLDQLPNTGFRLFAAPPKIKGIGSFPVRAFALIDS
jgi:arylformamidase